MTAQQNKTLIALDVGERRIGVAVASLVARLPRPAGVIMQSEETFAQIAELIAAERAVGVVVGLPRNLAGQDTGQTKYVRDFTANLQSAIGTPVYWCDEALTSHLAEIELQKRQATYTKGDIDALAACYILEDFLSSHKEDKLS